MFLIQSSLQRNFASEIKSIKADTPFQVSNVLLPHPVLIGVLLRVGGCLVNAQISVFKKHPLILNGKYILTLVAKGNSHSCKVLQPAIHSTLHYPGGVLLVDL